MAFRMGGLHLFPKLLSTSFRYASVQNNFTHAKSCFITWYSQDVSTQP